MARLARLQLSEDELEPMARELSAVLDHIAKIGELDLDGVAPTTHVVELTGALRPDERAAVAAARGGARPGACRQRRRISRSRARRHERDGDHRPVRRAGGRGRSPRASCARRSCSRPIAPALREHAADGDGLNCFTWVADGSTGAERVRPGGRFRASRRGPAGRRAAGGEGPVLHRGRAQPVGVEDPRGLPAAVHRHRRLAPDRGAARACWRRPTRTSSRWAPRTENSAYGPVLNPWDRTRVPGGSSGGSAAAVAAGLAPWALGTDTGGSIRQPAALCGIVGLKPTYGAVSRYGMIAFASSLDQAGPLTRDVTDAALMLRHLVGRDECDATSLRFPEEIALPSAERLDGIRLGVPQELTADSGGDAARRGDRSGRARGVRARAAAAPRSSGRRSSQSVQLPHAPHALAAYYVLAPAEASSNLARFDGVRYGLRAEGAERPARHVHAHAPRRLRRGGQAADHARHLRALLRLLRRLLRSRPARAHEDRRGLPRGVRARST